MEALTGRRSHWPECDDTGPLHRLTHGEFVTNLVAEWRALVCDIRDAGLKIFADAELLVTAKGFADEKVLALTLLVRTVSHIKGALLLIDARRIVEARTITRCCLENLYWVV